MKKEAAITTTSAELIQQVGSGQSIIAIPGTFVIDETLMLKQGQTLQGCQH